MKSGLSKDQEQILLLLARRAICRRLDPKIELPQKPVGQIFNNKAATFVTLKLNNQLRGCIGTLEATTSLWQSVHDNGVAAAFSDSRFSPVGLKEVEKIKIDISVLTSPSPLEYTDSVDLIKKLRPGIDGVVLRDGASGATFLPQVWQQLPTAELFLDQLCLKAGLGKNDWRKRVLAIKTYQVQSIEEEKG